MLEWPMTSGVYALVGEVDRRRGILGITVLHPSTERSFFWEGI